MLEIWIMLKVREFQNENLKSKHCLKYERKNLQNSALSNFFVHIRLVHVLWYNILECYFGMILWYFEIRINYTNFLLVQNRFFLSFPLQKVNIDKFLSLISSRNNVQDDMNKFHNAKPKNDCVLFACWKMADTL